MDRLGDILGSIWDRGLQVFDRVADYELSRYEMGLISQAQANELAANNVQAVSAAETQKWVTWAVIGGGAVLVFLLLRRK